MKAISDKLTSILKEVLRLREESDDYFFGTNFLELVSPWEIFGGADFFALSFSNTLSCSSSMLLNSNATAAAISSSLRLNFSTYFFIAYSFPIFRAQPNNNNSPKVIKVAPHGKITSLQIFFTIVV